MTESMWPKKGATFIATDVGIVFEFDGEKWRPKEDVADYLSRQERRPQMKHNWEKMSAVERNALVATEVMGWVDDERSPNPHCYWRKPDDKCVLKLDFSPSTQIADAMEVLGKFVSFDIAKVQGKHRCDGKTAYWVEVRKGKSRFDGTSINSLPEAICLAALRAKGVEV